MREPMTPERLQEIDEELSSFGKSDEALAEVVTRARALAAEAEGDLAALVQGLDEARAAASASARAAVRDAVEELTPDAPEEPEGSGLVEIPEDVIRGEALPPVLDLNEHDRMSQRPPKLVEDTPFVEESTDVHSAEDIERAIVSSRPPPRDAAAGSSDIAGLSVDELFEDAEPSAAAVSTEGGLADLFDDEEELRLSDPDGFQGLEGQLEPAEADKEFELGPPIGADEEEQTDLVRGEDLARFPLVGQEYGAPSADEEQEESTMLFSVDELRDIQTENTAGEGEDLGSDDFELLVDEDVLELDMDDAPPVKRSAAPPPPAAASDEDDDGENGGGGKGGGLISRILGRK
ncbi:MAG: hypothetical protein SangKO_074650 [Sandaracinaceae bacterium]